MNTEVEFNSDFFDNASMLWKQNKKYIGNGVYAYLCEGVFKNKKCCLRKACKESLMDVWAPQRYCKLHYQSYQKDLINSKKIRENKEKKENIQIKEKNIENNLPKNQNKECKTSICRQYDLRKKNNKRKRDYLYDDEDLDDK